MRTILLSLTLAASVASASTILGMGVEADYYSPKASGDFSYTANGTTTNTHFNNNSESTYQLGVYLEHPVPLLPNVRLDVTPEASFSGSDGLGGMNKVSINQMDITPYYEVLDNVVDLDIGVSFKVVDAKIEGSINQEFKETIPMGYIGVGVDLPGTGLRIAGDVKYVEYSGDSLSDSRIKAVWKMAAGLEAQAGYRYERLEINDHFGVRSNVTIEGPFVGLAYRF